MSIKTKIATLAIAALAADRGRDHLGVREAEDQPGCGRPASAPRLSAPRSPLRPAPHYGYYPHHRHCFSKPQYNMFGHVHRLRRPRLPLALID